MLALRRLTYTHSESNTQNKENKSTKKTKVRGVYRAHNRSSHTHSHIRGERGRWRTAKLCDGAGFTDYNKKERRKEKKKATLSVGCRSGRSFSIFSKANERESGGHNLQDHIISGGKESFHTYTSKTIADCRGC